MWDTLALLSVKNVLSGMHFIIFPSLPFLTWKIAYFSTFKPYPSQKYQKVICYLLSLARTCYVAVCVAVASWTSVPNNFSSFSIPHWIIALDRAIHNSSILFIQL